MARVRFGLVSSDGLSSMAASLSLAASIAAAQWVESVKNRFVGDYFRIKLF
jgi:hypothetical protein